MVSDSRPGPGGPGPGPGPGKAKVRSGTAWSESGVQLGSAVKLCRVRVSGHVTVTAGYRDPGLRKRASP
jgi:hypothetical protein